MTKTEILELVKELTEHKADSKVNFDRMLLNRLQKIVQFRKFWWRRKVATFNTIATQATYDLTASAQGTINDIEQLTKVRLVYSATDVRKLNGIFDEDELILVKLATDTGPPERYCLNAGTSLWTMLLTPIPSGVWPIYLSYWACPVSVEQDEIPLLPVAYHHVLASGLKMDLHNMLWGPNDRKYLTAKEEYEEGMRAILQPRDYSDERVDEFRGGEAAVRST